VKERTNNAKDSSIYCRKGCKEKGISFFPAVEGAAKV